MSDPIHLLIDEWHDFLQGGGALEHLLADEVVFYSPVVYTPQRGKDVTMMYLQAAKQVLPGSEPDGQFRYTKEVLAGNQAVLEFETSLAGKYVNGVDIITCNDEGLIVEFRVMIRPLQAINLVHEQMRRQLEAMQA